jgi:hypothetical protein
MNMDTTTTTASFPSVSAKPTRPDKAKYDICHLDEETGLFSLKRVNAKAMAAHLRHGDVLPVDGSCPVPVPDEPEPTV